MTVPVFLLLFLLPAEPVRPPAKQPVPSPPASGARSSATGNETTPATGEVPAAGHLWQPAAGRNTSAPADEAPALLAPQNAPQNAQGRLPRRTYAAEGGQLTRDTVEGYLSRAVTMLGMADDVLGGGTDVDLSNLPDSVRQNVIDAVRADDIRFIFAVGARFIGRAAGVWGDWQETERFARAAETAALVHNAPGGADVVLQAAIYEYVHPNMMLDPGRVVPQWALAEFGLPGGPRAFRFADMAFADYATNPDHRLGDGGAFVDISRPEAQLWVFYRAVRYLDAGYEALHLGQVETMGGNDPGGAHWWGVLRRIRAFAAGRLPLFDVSLGRALRPARRGFVLCDGHTTGLYYSQAAGADRPDQLIFDFHSCPLRPAQYRASARANTGFSPQIQRFLARLHLVAPVAGGFLGNLSPSLGPDDGGNWPAAETENRPIGPKNRKGWSGGLAATRFPAPMVELRRGFHNAIYGRSRGGYAPLPPHEGSQHAPFLVEFDNFGVFDRADDAWSAWGFDDITWFGACQHPNAGPGMFETNAHAALPDAATRDHYLRELWRQVRRLDGNGWLQLPARRDVVLRQHRTVDPRLPLAPAQFTYRANSAAAPWPPPGFPASTPRPPHYGNQELAIQELFAGASGTWERLALSGRADVAGDVLAADGQLFYRSHGNQLCGLHRERAGLPDSATGPMRWQGPLLPVADVRGPVAYSREHARFFYRNTADGLSTVWYANGQWNHQPLGPLDAANYVADNLLIESSSGNCFYRTQTGRVAVCYRNGAGAWQQVAIGWDAPPARDGLVLVGENLYYRGQDNALHCLRWLP